MRQNSRVRVLERLTGAFNCTGGCPCCCGQNSRLTGKFTAAEQAEELLALIERAGLVFVADDVRALFGEDDEDTPPEAA